LKTAELETAKPVVDSVIAKFKPRRLADYPGVLAALFSEIEDADGEMTVDQSDLLEVLEVGFTEKVESTWLFARELEDRAAACQATASRYADRAASLTKKAARLKSFIVDAMQATGNTKVRGTFANVSLVKNSRPSIRWEGDVDFIPPAFQTIKTTVGLNSDEALKAWKDDRLPAGFTVQIGSHLRGT